jgi:hypothetical protein
MKKFAMIVALAAAAAAAPACNGDDETNKPTGDGDGDNIGGQGGQTTAGDGDGDDGAATCSDEVYTATSAGGAGGQGGGGGAPAAMCDMPDAPAENIAIAGSYEDQYMGAVEISNTVWDLGYAQYTLSLVNNEEGYAVARNAASDDFNPCSWSTFVWFEGDDGLHYCQSGFGAESECAAEGAMSPDPEELETGCSGFPWSTLTAK